MEILDKAYTALLAEGRLTMQVPDFAIGPCNTANEADEYFIYAKVVGFRKGHARYRVAVGREEGFLYMSRRGFEHFKPELQKAFNTHCNRGATWQDVEDYADTFYSNLHKECSTHLKRLQLEEQLKPTPYNQKRVKQMTDALQNIW